MLSTLNSISKADKAHMAARVRDVPLMDLWFPLRSLWNLSPKIHEVKKYFERNCYLSQMA